MYIKNVIFVMFFTLIPLPSLALDCDRWITCPEEEENFLSRDEVNAYIYGKNKKGLEPWRVTEETRKKVKINKNQDQATADQPNQENPSRDQEEPQEVSFNNPQSNQNTGDPLDSLPPEIRQTLIDTQTAPRTSQTTGVANPNPTPNFNVPDQNDQVIGARDETSDNIPIDPDAAFLEVDDDVIELTYEEEQELAAHLQRIRSGKE